MIVFVSNFFNHHQEELCNALKELLHDDFVFIATEPVPSERLQMGYSDMNRKYEYIFRAYDNQQSYLESIQLCARADIAILGSASDEYMKCRPSSALTIKYSERPYKNKNPIRNFISEIIHHYRFINKNVILLCASAYAAYDHAKFGMYIGKTYKWGYFPKTFNYNIKEIIIKKTPDLFVWAGRIIDWKHLEIAIDLISKMKSSGQRCYLRVIGIGPLMDQMMQRAIDKNVENEVSFLGALSPEEVRTEMLKASFFIATSDYKEGWGAVINEAMNSGCCVFASKAMGSVPFLIEDGVNGFSFENEVELFDKVKLIINNSEKQPLIEENAYWTIKNGWTSDEAAKRLLCLINSLQLGNPLPYTDGVCSPAKVLKG